MSVRIQSYKTCAHDGEDEFIERKSRFIGYLSHAADEEEAKAYIEMIRELHPEASHHVWCYVFKGGAVVRSSDDGEPSGTAGRPVAEVILREGLTDVVCVVVRYFGGILLGAGGLIRAYATGARMAVDAAGVAEMTPMDVFRVTLPYHFHGKITSRLTRDGYKPENPVFAEKVSFDLTVSPEEKDRLQALLADLTAGEARFDELGCKFMPVIL